MSGLRFVPLGVGDAFTALHYSSCLAIEAAGEWILVDCPHPIQKMMREASAQSGVVIAPERISGVVLTHLHGDHASGLEGLAYYFHFGLRKRLKLLVHPHVEERLWSGHLAAGMEQLLPAVGAKAREMKFEDYFDRISLREGAPVQFGPFEIDCRMTIHHVPTTALRFRAEGRSLGYSADTAFDPTLIEWLAAADTVIHETNLGIHTPYESLAALPLELRKRMKLIHYPDAFDLGSSVIEPLVQGRLYQA